MDLFHSRRKIYSLLHFSTGNQLSGYSMGLSGKYFLILRLNRLIFLKLKREMMCSKFLSILSSNHCANFDTFMKLGTVEDNPLRIEKSMGDKFKNK